MCWSVILHCIITHNGHIKGKLGIILVVFLFACSPGRIWSWPLTTLIGPGTQLFVASKGTEETNLEHVVTVRTE